jgi:predicted membrane-bound mannosyltransferase
MADDKNRKGPEDPNRINVNQPHEVLYWTKELSINEATLRLAVDIVGVMVVDVRDWLNRNRINLNQPHEVLYWTKELSINEATLRLAVDKVGVMVVDVRDWLNRTENKWRRVN